MYKYRQEGYFVVAALQELLIAKHQTSISLCVLLGMFNGALSSRYFSVKNGTIDEGVDGLVNERMWNICGHMKGSLTDKYQNE
jgi:hypothetical protein